MTPTCQVSLSDRLVQLERPVSHLIEVRDESLLGRLYARPALHRALPVGLAVRLARTRGRIEWLVPSRRNGAIERATSLAGPFASPGEIRRLAREQLMELAIQTELSWHPEAAGRMHIRGLEHLQRARAGAHGVILATVHMGPVLSLAYALAARRYRLYLSGGTRLDESPVRGDHGRWAKTQNVWLEEAGCRWVHRGGSYELLRALLARGEVCWMTWDTPGRRNVPVRLLGRTCHVGGNVARLALETGARIVPGFAWREANTAVGSLSGVIDAGEATDESEINHRVAIAVESALAPRLAQANVGIAHNHDWRPRGEGLAPVGAGPVAQP